MPEPTSPTDPEVIRRATALITYLKRLVGTSARQTIRDSLAGNRVIWLDDYPSGSSVGSSVVARAERLPRTPPRPPSILGGESDDEWNDSRGPEPQPDVDHLDTQSAGAVDQWLTRWRQWAAATRRFDDLDDLARRAAMLADSHELVVAVGLLAGDHRS